LGITNTKTKISRSPKRLRKATSEPVKINKPTKIVERFGFSERCWERERHQRSKASNVCRGPQKVQTHKNAENSIRASAD